MSTIVLDGGPVWLFLLVRLIEFGLIIFFTAIWCLSMERAMKACDPSSRKMQPGYSWLIFIPLFGLVWQFIAVKNVSLSLATEYHLRGWKSDEGRPGIEMGMIACFVVIIVLIARILIPDLNPGIAFFTSLGVCGVMFMHRDRINAFTERLEDENRKSQQYFHFQGAPNPFVQSQFYQQQPYGHSYQQPPPGGFAYGQQQVPPSQQYSHQQYVQDAAKQYQQAQEKQRQQEEYSRPGWDGTTVWQPPAGWQYPDLSDPSGYFS